MKKAAILAVAFAILISGAPAAGVQSAAPVRAKSAAQTRLLRRIYSARLKIEEVVLNCTVLDNKGELVNDLTKSNFKVFEDKTPQTVYLPPAPGHSCFDRSARRLISGSMSTKRAAVAAAALDLVKASNPHTRPS